MHSTPARKLYTAKEAALLLGISKSTMYEHIARSLIPIVQIGGTIRITPTTLEKILGEHPPPPHEIAQLVAEG